MKQHTIIFIPHARAKFRKLRVTTLQVGLAAAAFVTLTAGTFAIAALSFDSDIDRDALSRIEQENAELRAVNQRFEESLSELDDQLDDYQQRIHDLALVAGVSGLSPAGEPGIGGLSAADGRFIATDDPFAPLQHRIDSLDSGIDAVLGGLEERSLRLASTPTIRPVAGILTSGFGYRRDPFNGSRAFHQGLDIVAPHGRTVRAPGAGVVVKAGRDGGYGNVIYLSHGNGITTRYGHLSAIEVEVGQSVERGDTLGRVGSTGRSTGAHLHYEIRIDGLPTNPLGYILDDPA